MTLPHLTGAPRLFRNAITATHRCQASPLLSQAMLSAVQDCSTQVSSKSTTVPENTATTGCCIS